MKEKKWGWGSWAQLGYPLLGAAMPLLRRPPLRDVWFLSSLVSACPSTEIPSPLRAVWVLGFLVPAYPSIQVEILPIPTCFRLHKHVLTIFYLKIHIQSLEPTFSLLSFGFIVWSQGSLSSPQLHLSAIPFGLPPFLCVSHPTLRMLSIRDLTMATLD